MGSFGFIDKAKLNHVVCETVRALNERFENKLIYLMVGDGDYIDKYLGPNIRKTGHVGLAEFNSLIKHSDIVINLRNPTMGETSGAMIRALSLGKPCIVSNDAWFGNSTQPSQHLQVAQMRAIETGRPLLRATNTGVTAIVDHKGQIQSKLPQFVAQVLNGTIQAMSGSTPYSIVGNWLIISSLMLIMAYFGFSCRRQATEFKRPAA